VVSSCSAVSALGSGFGDRRRFFAASYLDQEKGQAEALTVGKENSSSITDLLCALKVACQLATQRPSLRKERSEGNLPWKGCGSTQLPDSCIVFQVIDDVEKAMREVRTANSRPKTSLTIRTKQDVVWGEVAVDYSHVYERGQDRDFHLIPSFVVRAVLLSYMLS